MTNFDVIADRIINAEVVSFAIACAMNNTSGAPIVVERREALKRVIVEALENVHMDTVNAAVQVMELSKGESK
jgi:hypothetical protein